MKRIGQTIYGPSTTERVVLAIVFLGFLFLLVADELPTGLGTRVDPVKNSQRSLATGLEAYFIDHQAYPAMVPLRSYASDPEKLRQAGGTNVMAIAPGSTLGHGLTTPVAYVNFRFTDPYAPEKYLPYGYYADGHGWILYSPGRDRWYDLIPEDDYDGAISQPSPHLLLKAFDPTNGTISGGDIWRVKQ